MNNFPSNPEVVYQCDSVTAHVFYGVYAGGGGILGRGVPVGGPPTPASNSSSQSSTNLSLGTDSSYDEYGLSRLVADMMTESAPEATMR